MMATDSKDDYDIVCPACEAKMRDGDCACYQTVLYPDFAPFEGQIRCKKCGKTLRFSIDYVPTNDAPEVEVVDDGDDEDD